MMATNHHDDCSPMVGQRAYLSPERLAGLRLWKQVPYSPSPCVAAVCIAIRVVNKLFKPPNLKPQLYHYVEVRGT